MERDPLDGMMILPFILICTIAVACLIAMGETKEAETAGKYPIQFGPAYDKNHRLVDPGPRYSAAPPAVIPAPSFVYPVMHITENPMVAKLDRLEQHMNKLASQIETLNRILTPAEAPCINLSR